MPETRPRSAYDTALLPVSVISTNPLVGFMLRSTL